MAKKHKRTHAPDPAGLVDGFTMPELGRERHVILTYNPGMDTVEIDDTGCSPLEARAIVRQASEQLLHIFEE